MLDIQPSPSQALTQQFTLMGTIDVEAVSALETLYDIPAGAVIELDFALVQRVNSMGLAQLLKLFQHWQQRNVQMSITNVNRMIGVLFKMTGLTRFLVGNTAPESVKPDSTTVHSLHTDVPQRTVGRLNLWVNAQNSHQMNGWYFFNTYLQRQLGREVHLELIHGAMNEQDKRMDTMDIVFTKPFEATRLVLEHRFRPLLRPIDQTDEVTLLVREDDVRKTAADFANARVVTAAPDNFVYLLGRFLLEESAPGKTFNYSFLGHDIKALQTLLKGDADILFMLTETYNGLSSLTKKMLRTLDQSETAFAFHLFCAAPNCIEVGNALSEVLLNMSQDSQGRQVLADLDITGWCKPKQDEIAMLAMLFNRYAQTEPQAQRKVV